MREIKFRVWEEWSKKFKYIDSNYHLGYWACDAGSGPERSLSELNWQQYTGLKDVNGKEIYEGDVVVEEIETRKYQPFVVKWHNEYAGFDMSSSPSWTILGNIYENPELL